MAARPALEAMLGLFLAHLSFVILALRAAIRSLRFLPEASPQAALPLDFVLFIAQCVLPPKVATQYR